MMQKKAREEKAARMMAEKHAFSLANFVRPFFLRAFLCVTLGEVSKQMGCS